MKRFFLNVALYTTILAFIGPSRLDSVPNEIDLSQLRRNYMTYVPGQVLVQYRPSVSEDYAATNVGSKRHSFLKALPRMDRRKGPMAVVQLQEKVTVEEAVSQFENDPDVEFAQPNYIYRVNVAPNDTSYGQLWGLKNTNQYVTSGGYTNNPPGAGYVGNDIKAELAWDVITDCSSVTVAVIDSGVNYNHVDLAGNMVNGSYTCPGGTGTRGCDFVGAGDNNPMDYNGHGTHVAGTIGAVGNNGMGVAGVCWKASILAVRVLDATGSGTTADIVEGLAFAVGTGAGQGKAKVVNMSLGGGGASDTAFSNAITTARTNGVVVVVAAGNSGNNTTTVPSYPCNYSQDNILCVAAADQRYTRASFSNYSSTHVDIAAPGTNILSTYAGVSVAPVYDSMAGWTIATTTGTPWGMSSCSSAVLGATLPMLLLPNNCVTVLNGTAEGYAANTDATIYKQLTVPAGADSVILSFLATIDLEPGYDIFWGYHAAAAGNPVPSGSKFTELSIELNGGWGILESELKDCNGSATCTVGFRITTDGIANKSGVGVAALGLSGFDVDVTNVYLPENGTSMAAPHVAGVATMVRARNPNFTYTDTINAILAGGDLATSTLSTAYTKSGKMLNAYGALKYIPPTEGVSVSSP